CNASGLDGRTAGGTEPSPKFERPAAVSARHPRMLGPHVEALSDQSARICQRGEDIRMDWGFAAEDADAYQELAPSVERDARPEVVLIHGPTTDPWSNLATRIRFRHDVAPRVGRATRRGRTTVFPRAVSRGIPLARRAVGHAAGCGRCTGRTRRTSG